MTTPEPLDEFPAGAVETRGGDHLSDISVPDVPDDEQVCTCGGQGCAL